MIFFGHVWGKSCKTWHPFQTWASSRGWNFLCLLLAGLESVFISLFPFFSFQFALSNFVVLWWTFDIWRFYFKMEKSQIFSFFLIKIYYVDLNNEQLDEIEQKAQAKNTKRARVGSKKVREMVWYIYSGSVNTVKFCKSSSLKWKQRKAVH